LDARRRPREAVRHAVRSWGPCGDRTHWSKAGEQGGALDLRGRDACDPEASPHFAELSGFSPTLIQVRKDEIRLDGCARLAEAFKAVGVEVMREAYDMT